MDSGYVAPGHTFDPEFDPTSSLDLPEVLWIIDQLFCLEITWHDGYPLSQTVFTSLHVDRLLDPTRDPPSVALLNKVRYSKDSPAESMLGLEIVQIYCIALIKCCQLVLHLIQSQNFYEEEDFVTHLFGRELLPQISADRALELLHEAVSLVSSVETQDDVSNALLKRLQFRLSFLQNLMNDDDEWNDMANYIREIKTDHDLATPLPAAFSEKVQRQLATSTPPRPMLQISWDLACQKWTELCHDVVAAKCLTDFSIIQSPASLHRAVWAFSYRGDPCTLSRAVMQDTLFGNQAIRGEIPHYDLLLTDIRDLVLAGDSLVDPQSFQIEVTSDPRHICSRTMEGFMDQAIDEYMNLYRMVCQNRCRIRRTFTQAIPILDSLETEAINADLQLSKNTSSLRNSSKSDARTESLQPLTSWTKFHKLRIMAWTVQLGFETEIYLADELGNMYWFLSRLCDRRSRLIEHIRDFMTKRMSSLKEKGSAEECLEATEWLKVLYDQTEIARLMSEALWKLYTLLTAENVISVPNRDFATPQLLYDARMKPFLRVANDAIPSVKDFEEARRQVESVDSTCKTIDEHIKAAKGLLAAVKKLTPEQGRYVGTEEQWKKEIKGLETTCVAIVVASLQLLRAREKYGQDELSEHLECTPEKKYSDWWVIPILKERAKA